MHLPFPQLAELFLQDEFVWDPELFLKIRAE